MGVDEEKYAAQADVTQPDIDNGEIPADNADNLHRRLNNRQIQLIAIGGSIGTAVFVTIGGALYAGGPGSLFIAYLIYSSIIGLVNNGMAEMTIYMPVSGGFVRLAGEWVGDAWGFMAGWNFFLYEALIIPFEITALNLVLKFWRDDIPVAAVCAVTIFLYGLINVLAVRAYGEAEFWLSGGKVFLIAILFSMTFFTMVGANPKRDPYGFRYWKNPGSFAGDGSIGKFEGFLTCLWSASFTIVGPEYLSMVAGEAKRPRIFMKTAFKTAYWRFGIFFIGSALCVGIVTPYNDPTLVAILSGKSGGKGSAAASPYVIAMNNLGIGGLPHLTNALLVTSIFSAGNTYTYCATRGLYGLALEGRAPGFLKQCTKSGIPIYAFAITMIFPCLSFLSVSSGSAKVLGWLINLVTAGGVITYIVMTTTYIFWHRATVAQNFDRKALPYYAYLQPWSTYLALVFETLVLIFYGYSSISPFDVQSFFIYYAMVFVAIFNFALWTIVKRKKLVNPLESNLIWEAPLIDAYEASFENAPVGFWTEMIQLLGIKRKAGMDRRRSSVAYVRRDSVQSKQGHH